MSKENQKTYAILLAGGVGSRLNVKQPKQLLLANKIKKMPLFIYPLYTFLRLAKLDHIILVVNKENEGDYNKYLKEYEISDQYVSVTLGGKTRHDSIINGLKQLKYLFKPNKDDIIITHDVARVLVNKNVISSSISMLANKKCDVVTTVCVSNDTIATVKNDVVTKVLSYDSTFLVQTPQSSYYSIFEEIYFTKKLDANQLESAHDFSKLATFLNKKIKVVYGDKYNFKLTDEFDLKILEKLLPE